MGRRPVLHREPVNWKNQLNDGLVSWWLPLANSQGGNTLRDLCGRYHGTLGASTAAPSWVAGPPGFLAQSLDFDGGDNVALPLTTSPTAYTYSMWICGDDTTSNNLSNTQPFVIGTTSDSAGFSWDHGNAAFYRAAFHRDSGGAYFSSQLSADLSAGVWYYLTVAWTGASLQCYVNGEADGSSSSPASFRALSGSSYISRLTVPWPGKITDVKLWYRGLSAAEVREHYRQSRLNHLDTLRWKRRPVGKVAAAPATGNPWYYYAQM